MEQMNTEFSAERLQQRSGALYPEARFEARGPVSEQLLRALRYPMSQAEEHLEGLPERVLAQIHSSPDIFRDDDLQLSLLILHGLYYGEVVEADEDWEWHPVMVAVRVAIEREFERNLREFTPSEPLPEANAEAVAEYFFELTKPKPGPGLARFIAKEATQEQLQEFVILRSVYTLKEADAQTWTIPRLFGRPKAALVEIQADEYGGGIPERMHSAIFARLMHSLGLDNRYGAYVDYVPAITLASFNLMGMFGLNRRLRGASAGHFAVYEMTSSIPNKLIGDGFRRHGYGENITDYFDEHVEADAVHEQIAGRDLAGGLAEQEPQLLNDIVLGAYSSMMIDGWAADAIFQDWTAGRSALRQPPTIVNRPEEG